jgi:murein DD-endopeptidase MepM/ murein hydrolase activator NlpD
MLFVKTSDGTSWQGRFDNSSLAVDSPASVDRWVQELQAKGLEFHAWCVLNGLDIEAEADLVIAVCKRPGVRSMILDIEPYAGFWQGGKEAIRPLMLRVRQALGGAFHIGLSVDPRPWHYESIHPAEWYPFVNSVHPQSYWSTFRREPDEVLDQTFATWGGYGRPIIPVLQGDAPTSEQQVAFNVATQKHGAQGISWWRYGVISQWSVVNQVVVIGEPPAPEPPTDSETFTDERLITPDSADFRKGTYTGQEEFSSFNGTWNWTVYHKKTEVSGSRVWAEWKTELPQSGRYEIAVFVPARHATTARARYKIHGVKGTNREVVVDINQGRNRNIWVALGIFDLVKGAPNAGKVFLNDVTGEPDKEIAFDAVRFRRIVGVLPQPDPDTDPGGTGPDTIDGVYVANGFDAPIGTLEQRRGSRLWPEGWADASPFGKLYFVGTPSEAYHTGADLNWGSPYADKGLPIYAPASGIVTFAGPLRVWGNVIVIRHDPLSVPSGQVVYSRYGHVQEVQVQAGQRVKRGDQIAEIGDAFGRFVPHLHYDISPTTILERNPGDWPGKNLAYLLKNYMDPLDFTRNNRP